MKKITILALFALVAAPVFAQTPAAELDFYRKQSQTDDRKLLLTLTEDISAWLNKNYALPGADDALILKADIFARVKDYSAAAVTLLRHKYEFPSSKNAEGAKTVYIQVFNGTEKKKQDALNKLWNAKISNALPENRLADFLSAVTNLELKNCYEAVNEEYRNFFARFPAYENNDKMELKLGDLYRQNKNYLAAVMQYRKVYEIYPDTKYKAAALRMMGDIYAGELKDYDRAMSYYDGVLKNFPGSIERGTTYNHIAILAGTRKDYALAVSSITEAAKIYLAAGQHEDGYNALRYKAEIQENKVKDYAGAADTLNKTAEIFSKVQDKYVDTMMKAAGIYGNRLKDLYSQLGAYRKIITAYPSNPRTVTALYESGAISEKNGDYEAAKSFYSRLIVEHPADSLATKAQRRIEAVDKQIAKQQAAQT